MQIGVIGLGRMGGNISRRLMKAGHHCVVFDTNTKPREALAREGATAAGSLAEMVKALGGRPRAIWVMLPAGKITDDTVETLGGLLEPDDIVIDGGNSLLQGRHPPRQEISREAHSLHRLRHVRRRLGYRARLLPDDRRPKGGCGSPRPDLRGARARSRRYSAHTRPRERRIRAPSAAIFMPALPVLGISSRWYITASNTD